MHFLLKFDIFFAKNEELSAIYEGNLYILQSTALIPELNVLCFNYVITPHPVFS